MKELNKTQKYAVIGLFLCSFALSLIGLSYYISAQNACECPDCFTKRFFVFEEVEDYDNFNYTDFITWYDNEYAPICEEVLE